jgi:dTMP kinase
MVKYIVFEGVEGVGKTTQTQKLVDYLKQQGFKVLQTKEPGINLLPLTMKLREIMLSSEFDSQLTISAREFISQAIRSIHLEHLISKNLNNNYDFIIQDRGILSGLAYGEACGNDINFLLSLSQKVVEPLNKTIYSLYDKVIYFKGDSKKSLQKAIESKQEYASGDAIEAKGEEFITNVEILMESHISKFDCSTIYIDNKDISTVFEEIKIILKI